MATAALLLLLAVTVQLVFSPAACSSSASYYCDWCPRRSNASLFPPDAGLSGACGYEPTAAAQLDGGYYIAAASAEFFRHGGGCGACYQLRCRGRRVCGENGIKVVVADVAGTETTTHWTGGGGRFLLNRDAFTAMASNHAMPAHDDQPASLDTVEVDFRRIPCEYKNKNLAVKVEETSRKDRGYLAVRFLYQGGQTDIAAVEIAQVVVGANNAATPTWRYMTRREGSPAAVWRTSRAPAGPLQLRVVVTAGSGGKWLRADGEVLPAEWQPGGVYDTGLRITDVALRTCGDASCGAAGDQEDDELR